MGDIFTWISTAVLGVCGQPVDIVYTEESCGSYAVPSLSSVNDFFLDRIRERQLRMRVNIVEREVQQVRREANEAREALQEAARMEREGGRVRAARRAFMEELKRRRDNGDKRRGPE